MGNDAIRITVCYPLPGDPQLRELEVAAGTTLIEALTASGLPAQFPQLELSACKLGIYGKIREASTVLRDGDRIEVYRPLLADPKEARRRRVEKKRAGA
jgi:putative ubiquitin-RnfH superfamily antitoxin RatB of RatAB toxin-antitoxin module